MSKDKAIAKIIKNLDLLSIEENNSILQYIKRRKSSKAAEKARKVASKSNKAKKPIHVNRDGVEIAKGDKVYLLTPGVDNIVGELGTVEHLPKTVGEYVLFKRERLRENGYAAYIHKLGKSMRKKP